MHKAHRGSQQTARFNDHYLKNCLIVTKHLYFRRARAHTVRASQHHTKIPRDEVRLPERERERPNTKEAQEKESQHEIEKKTKGKNKNHRKNNRTVKMNKIKNERRAELKKIANTHTHAGKTYGNAHTHTARHYLGWEWTEENSAQRTRLSSNSMRTSGKTQTLYHI